MRLFDFLKALIHVGNDMNSHCSYGLIVGQTELFNLGMVNGFGNGKL